MKKKHMLVIGLVVVMALLLVLYFHHHPVAVLQPRGIVASHERNLIIFTLLLAVIVVVPVYVLTFLIAHNYRASNKNAKYSPEWASNPAAELLWWAIPGVIILVLSVVTWNSSHSLDPLHPIAAKTAALNVQVVALDWKWLFIYPAQHLASVNQLELPVNTPVSFAVTADAPMNSFWIPQLGSQIYAMPGMATGLNMMATKAGDYYGSSANISGDGFASMNFTAHAVSTSEFKAWAGQPVDNKLDWNVYQQLAQASQNNPPATFKLADSQLFSQIIDKYILPAGHYSIAAASGGGH